MHSSVLICYRVEDSEQQKPYAVKITRDDDEEKKIASRNEFEITRNLDHKNLIKSYELFENELTGELLQVMDYVNGEEVLDLIAKQPLGCYTEN